MVFLNGAEIWKAPGEVGERHVITKEEVVRLHQIATERDVWFWGKKKHRLSEGQATATYFTLRVACPIFVLTSYF